MKRKDTIMTKQRLFRTIWWIFVPETTIQNLLNQLEETFEQCKNDQKFIAQNTNIIWKIDYR